LADTKISAGADPGTLVATDKLPLARSASTTAYAATVAELAAFANGAYVPNYATANPSMDGAAAPGTASTVSRGDHVHPTDTTRAAASAIPAPAATPPAMDGTAAAGSAVTYSRADHVHPSDTALLALGGGTMTGFLTLNAVPSVSLHAATKGYVDTATGSSTAAIPGASYADNSGFAINQRSYVSGTALAAGAFGHDRWKAGASGCTYTFTQSGNPATTITITAGTLQQVVEGAVVLGGIYTLSWTGTAQGRVGGGGYAASPVTTGSLTAAANATIEFNAGTLGRVKFEAGSTATPWVADPPQQDLARCQRFFQTHGLMISGYNTAAAGIYQNVLLPVTMRAAPTAVYSGVGYSNCASIGANSTTVAALTTQVAITATGSCFATYNVTLSADL
jgi:hypothetical protein